MGDMLRISQVAAKYGISKRTLRYYEEIGLIECKRTEDYSYRSYDDASINRLEQILLLRSLDFSIKDISEILLNCDNTLTNSILQQRYRDVQNELGRVTSISKILETIIKQTQNIERADIKVDQLLKAQIYINRKVEGVLHMNRYEGDIFVLEFGINIIQYANDIINCVKELRKELEAEYNKELPLIRIRDEESLNSYQYRLLVKGIVTFDETFDFSANINIPSKIISDLKAIILKNL